MTVLNPTSLEPDLSTRLWIDRNKGSRFKKGAVKKRETKPPSNIALTIFFPREMLSHDS